LFLVAGNTFRDLAKIQLNQVQSKHEAATQYVEAANCYRKADFEGTDGLSLLYYMYIIIRILG